MVNPPLLHIHWSGDQVNELFAVGHYIIHCFKIFAFEKYHDLETRVRGHSRSLEMIIL